MTGVRYIDVRTAYLPSEDDFFCYHGLHGHKTSHLLDQVADFLLTRPHEVVILDFNHTLGFSSEHYARLAKLIEDKLSGKLLPPLPPVNTQEPQGPQKTQNAQKTLIAKGFPSLNEIWKMGKQVIIVYNSGVSESKFWSQQTICSPFYNTLSVDCLMTSLEDSSPHQGVFNVSQAILTPRPKTVALHLFSSLEKRLAGKCNEAVCEWLKEICAKKRGVNIVMCDFVTKHDIPKHVVRLNYV